MQGSCSLPRFKGVSEEDILEEIREQGVIHVRRLNVRRNDVLKDTNTFEFTFNTSVLPKQLKVAFLRVSVDPYIPIPLKCFACQVFGHHERGWSGGAIVLGKLPVPGRHAYLDKSRARAFCVCSRCGWGLFGHSFSSLSFLFLSPSLWVGWLVVLGLTAL